MWCLKRILSSYCWIGEEWGVLSELLMSKSGLIVIRLIPVLMQLLGIAGILFGCWYSAGMIIGSGIGSPTGKANESLYVTAGWMVGVPAIVFLAGWVWVTIGFLVAPKR